MLRKLFNLIKKLFTRHEDNHKQNLESDLPYFNPMSLITHPVLFFKRNLLDKDNKPTGLAILLGLLILAFLFGYIRF